MKRNIFIRITCLMLCASMLVPTTASAFGSPPGAITNQMRYVNQFFNHAGGRSAAGKALEKWLDMGIREEGIERMNSGYLMLEQELEYQDSSLKYKAIDTTVRTARKSLETVSTFGLNLAAEAITEAGFQAKYPGAGYSAYIYYQNLYNIYNEYVNEVMTALIEADQSLDLYEAIFGEVVEYGSDLAYANCLETTGALVFVGKKVKAGTGVFAPTLTDLKYTKTKDGFADVEFHILRADGTPDVLTMDILEQKYFNKGIPVSIDVPSEIRRRLDLDPERLTAIVDSEMLRIGGIDTPKQRLNYKNLRYEYMDGFLDATDPGTMRNLGSIEDDSIKQALSNSKDNVTKQRSARAQAAKEKASDIGGVAADSVLAGISMYQTSVRQGIYIDIITGVTAQYVDMLEAWRDSALGVAGTKDKGANADIKAAVKAILDDIKAVEEKAVTAHIVGDTIVMNAGNLSEIFLGVFESTSYFQKFKNLIEATKSGGAESIRDALVNGTNKYVPSSANLFTKAKVALKNFASIEVNPLLAASIQSMVLNAATDKMVDFGNQASSIYYLKWSLRNLILNRGGLLDQYIENPSHEKACAVIEALNTMKVAKYYGENMVQEYYLEDFYGWFDGLNIKPGGNVHTILWNELMLNKGDNLPTIANAIEPITIVYSSKPERMSSGAVRFALKIEGLYVDHGSTALKYEGRQLKAFSSLAERDKLEIKKRDSFDTAQISQSWISGGNVSIPQNEIDNYYICRGYLYSKNGLNVILTLEEYNQYEESREKVKELFELFENESYDEHDEIDFFKRDDFQNICRLEWTWYTRQWIESFEMYDDSTNYETHKITYGK